MKHIRHLLLIISLCAVCFGASPVHAEKLVYNISILDDYKFSGNDISQYAKGCIDSMFKFIDNASYETDRININDGIEALNTDSSDFLCMVPMSDALLSYIDYSEEPIGKGFLSLYTNSTSELFYESFHNFNNMKIGMLKNSYFEKDLNTYAQKNGFNYVPVYFNTISELTSAVEANMVNAMLAPSTNKPDNMRLIAKCGDINYYCAVKKGNQEMLDVLNNALRKLKNTYPFYIETDYQEFLTVPYLNTVGLTDDEYKAQKSHRTLRVLASDNNYPISYFDPELNRYAGVSVDILNKIAKNAGFELEYMPYNQAEMSMNGIVMGKADVLLTVSGSKQGLITATDPYTSISYIPVSKKEANVFEDSQLRVGILSNDSWIVDYLSESHPQWYLEKYDSINSLLHSVETEGVEVALLSSPDMQTKTSLIAHPSLAMITDFTVSIPVSLGVSKITCNQNIINLLNKSIISVSVSEAEMENKVYTLSNIYVPDFRDMILANKSWLLLILFALVAIFVILKIRESYFRKLSRTDSLTKLPNGDYFHSAALKTIEKKPHTSYLLTSLDARNFKLINDRFGHSVGDQTIINIASHIKSIFKDHGLYARSQSDNFLIFIEDTPANRDLLDELTNMDIYIHSTTKYKVPIKVGVCPIAKYDSDINLSGYVDRANIAKEHISGRNSNHIRYFTDEMEEELDTKNTIESEMVQALSRGDFIVYYQPKYDLSNDRIIGAEALVRWNHKERGIISPGLFIPLFEKNGFIIDLDFYVYESVMKMLKRRIELQKPIIPVSMNVSRCHLSERDFVDKLEALVQKYNIPKQFIEMEITESIFNREDNSAIALIYKLKEHGFTVSMDDFGSGYSSLNLLRNMPIDILKIDKVFIDNTENSPRGQVIVEEIISMATKICVKTICEGVETETQRDFLKKVGCNMVQGFFYSRPLPHVEFEALLNSSL